MSRRHRLVGIVVLVAVGSATVGWLAARRISSPAAALADAEAPTPSLITAPVEQRRLASQVTARGTVGFDDASDLTVEASDGGSSVVTGRVPENGAELTEGSVAVEVGGRPVLVLAGDLPAYRDLSPGDDGADVAQLEEALARLGHDPGPVDGVYDEETEGAVRALYEAAGYRPVELTQAQRQELRAQRDAVEAADDRVRNAELALDRASEPVTPDRRLEAEQRVAAAARAIDAAADQGAAALRLADAEVARAADAITAAEAALQTAVDRRAAAEAGTHPDTGAAPTDAERAVLAAAVTDAERSLAAVRAERTAADAARSETVRANERAAADATDQHRAAEMARDLLDQAPSTVAERRELDDAIGDRDRARAELAELDARYGVGLPRGEVVFYPTLPRRVGQVTARVGQAASGSLMRVSGAELRIDASVGAADRPLLSPGLAVRIVDDTLGIDLDGTVTRIADAPGTGGAPDGRYAVVITPEGGDGETLAGLNLRVEIPIEATAGEVLVVPLAALSASADGTSRVRVERSPGVVEDVEVDVGLSSEGYAEVTPVGAGRLDVGDQVVVGSAT